MNKLLEEKIITEMSTEAVMQLIRKFNLFVEKKNLGGKIKLVDYLNIANRICASFSVLVMHNIYKQHKDSINLTINDIDERLLQTIMHVSNEHTPRKLN